MTLTGKIEVLTAVSPYLEIAHRMSTERELKDSSWIQQSAADGPPIVPGMKVWVISFPTSRGEVDSFAERNVRVARRTLDEALDAAILACHDDVRAASAKATKKADDLKAAESMLLQFMGSV